MPKNAVTPQPRHDPRQSVWVEAELVGEIVPPEWHVDEDASCRRRRSGQHGELGPWIFSGGLGYRFNLFGPRVPEPAPIALK